MEEGDLVTITGGPWLMYVGFILEVRKNGTLLLEVGRTRVHVHKDDVLPYEGKASADAVHG